MSAPPIRRSGYVPGHAARPVRELCWPAGRNPRAPLEPPRRIVTGPRVGVSSAAEIPWRFWYEGEPTVSVYRAYVPRRRKLVTP